ncbi:MAG: hypothetical protein HY706_11130 [Candidatus Hydrogenedentes bacterium]|nr:hypothetical protein [Candidatus Hydrogenedentota bacterium]
MTVKRPIHIGGVIQNAVVFNLKHWTHPMRVDSLPQSVERLFSLLHERKIEYVLVGGIALLNYIEGRNTEDIDLIMGLDDLMRLPEIQIEQSDLDFARAHFEGLQVDILLTRNSLFAEIRRHYSTVQTFLERKIPVATVEGLLLLKLYALPSLYRQGKFTAVGIYENDVATLLFYHRHDTSALLKILSRHLSDTDVNALRDILQEIQQRHERLRKGVSEEPGAM